MPTNQLNDLQSSAGEIKPALNDISPSRQMTFGEKLVGLTFNPSGDEKVNRAKTLCAELAELINETPKEGQDEYLFRLIRDSAMREILNAQMNVVKLLTLKY